MYFQLKDYLVFGAMIVIVIWVSHQAHLWGANKGSVNAWYARVSQNMYSWRYKLVHWFLGQFSYFSESFGVKLKPHVARDYTRYAIRLNLKIKSLDREIKPHELDGLFKFLGIVGVFATLGCFLLTRSPFSLGFLLLCFSRKISIAVMTIAIYDEDVELENDFHDFYLMLYSRLLLGTQANLASPLDDYLESITAIYGEKGKERAIYKFASRLRNNISVYVSDSVAIRNLRDLYTSARVVNFIGLVTQSLTGIDNKDKLQSLNIELNNQHINTVTLLSEKAEMKGNVAIKLVYIILFEFVLLSIASKIDLSSLTSILGIK